MPGGPDFWHLLDPYSKSVVIVSQWQTRQDEQYLRCDSEDVSKLTGCLNVTLNQ